MIMVVINNLPSKQFCEENKRTMIRFQADPTNTWCNIYSKIIMEIHIEYFSFLSNLGRKNQTQLDLDKLACLWSTDNIRWPSYRCDWCVHQRKFSRWCILQTSWIYPHDSRYDNWTWKIYCLTYFQKNYQIFRTLC